MRNRKISFLIFLTIISFSIPGCEEDLLNIDIRDELEGNWNVSENNNLKSLDYYTVTISKSATDTSKIRIANFYAVSGTVQAGIKGFNLTIPQQNISTFTIQGYGTVSLNMKKIEWSYTVNHNNGFTDQVTAVYTKAK
jgi:hypothetical protein